MKHRALIAVAVSVLLTSSPAFALTIDVSGTCSIDRRTTRARCLRAKAIQKTNLRSSVQYRTNPDKELILERRLLRRSDLTDRGFTRKTNVESLRQEHIDALKKRRARARYEAQKRLEGKRTRDRSFQQDYSEMLRSRVRALGRPRYLRKSEQRTQVNRQKAAAQRRREAIRKAHTACKALGVGEREECLRKAQKSLK